MALTTIPNFKRTTCKVSDIIRWDRNQELVLQPKFQRRDVWEKDARSYLIDTVVRGYPLPKVFLRETLSGEKSSTVYEVVDGQQRLRAILDFVKGDLVLGKRHNPNLGDTTFDGLPEPLQKKFLSYEISLEIMENAPDPEVWAMFERLNTYTLTLNRQERLNAKWFGYFKQTCYLLAAEQSALEAWEQMRVFTNRQVARMKEVELTSDVIVALIEGVSDLTDVARAYRKYDEEFPNREEVANNFRNVLLFIKSEFGETVRRTGFKKKAWFYSLMVAAMDAIIGIRHGYGEKKLRSSEDIRNRMLYLSERLRPTPIELPPSLGSLHESLSRQTSHVRPRQIRHEYFYGMLTLSDSSWDEKLGLDQAPN